MRHVTPEEERHVMQALADVAPFTRALAAERDELQRRIELAVNRIDRLLTGKIALLRPYEQVSAFLVDSLSRELGSLRAVLYEGARPDLEPDDEPDGTMRRGMRGFTGGKP